MADPSPTAAESARRSLERYELAAIRQRNAVRTRLGLGDDELTALLYLMEHEQATQGQLLSISALTRSGVGAMAQRLEEAGLIERVPHPQDRRVRLLQLSARGSQRMRQARGAWDDERTRLLAQRSDDELLSLAGLLSAMAEATEHDPASRDGNSRAPGPRGEWRRWG